MKDVDEMTTDEMVQELAQWREILAKPGGEREQLDLENEKLRHEFMQKQIEAIDRSSGIEDLRAQEDRAWFAFRREEHRLQALWVHVFSASLQGILANANSTFQDFDAVFKHAGKYADALLGKKRPPYDPMTSGATATVTIAGEDRTPPMDKD